MSDAVEWDGERYGTVRRRRFRAGNEVAVSNNVESEGDYDTVGPDAAEFDRENKTAVADAVEFDRENETAVADAVEFEGATIQQCPTPSGLR